LSGGKIYSFPTQDIVIKTPYKSGASSGWCEEIWAIPKKYIYTGVLTNSFHNPPGKLEFQPGSALEK